MAAVPYQSRIRVPSAWVTESAMLPTCATAFDKLSASPKMSATMG